MTFIKRVYMKRKKHVTTKTKGLQAV